MIRPTVMGLGLAVALALLSAMAGTTGAPAGATVYTAVSAGAQFTCSLSAGGGVQCWGRNSEGQLGDATFNQRTRPVDVFGLHSGVTAVATGGAHTCALTSGGGAKCWGYNHDGQLGDGTTTNRNTPVAVVGLSSGVAGIAAGDAHTCALTTSGGAKCWGDNSNGQVGDGTTTDRTAPVGVSGMTSGVAALSAGQLHTCALTTGGGVKCWGYNNLGQLGDGSRTDSAEPVDVLGLQSGIAALEVGAQHSCALTLPGGVKCWGSNLAGQLGDDASGPIAPYPVDVCGDDPEDPCQHTLSGVAAVTAGSAHTCAAMTDGRLMCWGWDGFGQLGDGGSLSLPDERGYPREVEDVGDSGEPAVLAASTGAGHTCALSAIALVKCWGWNSNGQLGDGTLESNATAADFDLDGCSTSRELGPDQTQGGQRDPENFWDFFDTPDGDNNRDQVVNTQDVQRVQARYFATGDPMIDPLSLPDDPPAYHTAFDRTRIGPNVWNLGPPDGRILVDDILNAVRQSGHNCSDAP